MPDASASESFRKKPTENRPGASQRPVGSHLNISHLNPIRSVTPIPVNLVNIHAAAREIEVCGKGKSASGAVVSERGGFFGGVGVVGSKANLPFGFSGVI